MKRNYSWRGYWRAKVLLVVLQLLTPWAIYSIDPSFFKSGALSSYLVMWTCGFNACAAFAAPVLEIHGATFRAAQKFVNEGMYMIGEGADYPLHLTGDNKEDVDKFCDLTNELENTLR